MKKTVVITGTSSGLGKFTALLFLSKGWHVIATMRNPKVDTELSQHSNITLLELDITQPMQIQTQIDKLLCTHSVDVLVNNAGYGLIGPLEALEDTQITRQIETNLTGTIRVTKAFVRQFRERGQGTIINISSMFGLVGYPTCSIYAATKFALEGFSESLAYELEGMDIKVKTVAPGGIRTDFAGRSLQSATHPAYQGIIDKVSEGYSPEQLEKFSSPEMIAEVVYQAATDGINQLHYLAGDDVTKLYNDRETQGAEAHFKTILDNFKLNNKAIS